MAASADVDIVGEAALSRRRVVCRSLVAVIFATWTVYVGGCRGREVMVAVASCSTCWVEAAGLRRSAADEYRPVLAQNARLVCC